MFFFFPSGGPDSLKPYIVRSLCLFCLFLLGLWCVVWAIRSAIREEAEATRMALQDASSNAVRDNLESTIREGGDVAESLLGVLHDAVKKKNDTSDRNANDTDGPESERDHGSLVGELFRVGHEVTRELDHSLQEVIKLTPSERSLMGDRVHAAIKSEYKLLNDPDLTSRLRRLAKPFLDRIGVDADVLQFFVIDSPDINAFAHVGGYIYVNRGLIDFARNDDELAFVLGHEIAHVELGHCSRSSALAYRTEAAAGEFGAAMAQLAYQSIAVGYSEEMEFEADRWAIETEPVRMDAAIEFLKRLDGVQLLQTRTHPADLVDAALQQLDDHFATHPATRARIDALQ